MPTVHSGFAAGPLPGSQHWGPQRGPRTPGVPDVVCRVQQGMLEPVSPLSLSTTQGQGPRNARRARVLRREVVLPGAAPASRTLSPQAASWESQTALPPPEKQPRH